MNNQKIPDSVYEMSVDEMVEWLSFCKGSEQKTHFAFEPIKSQYVLNSILEYFIDRVQNGEPVDVRVKNYVLGNLRLIIDGQKKIAFGVGRGREPIPEIDCRWRACVVRYINELGITQRELSEALGVSERQVNEWLRYARDKVYSYHITAELIEELLLESGSSLSYKEMLLVLGEHRKIEIR